MASITSPTVAEGNSGITNMTFTFTRDSAAASQNFTYTISGGTATNGQDYSGTTGTFTIAAGTLTAPIVVQIFGDTAFEPDETFNISINETGNSTVLATGIGTIQNDDAAPVLSINDVTLGEGSGGGTTNFTFTVTRTGDLSGAASATYNFNYGTATAADFSGSPATTGTVSFGAGESTKTIVIPVLADNVVEGTENFTVVLSAPVGATLGTATGTGTINDDDASFSIAGVGLAEGTTATAPATTNFDFVVTRTGSTAGAATLNYAVTNGTTTAADFVGATSGTVTFNSGATTATVRIGVAADFDVETNENFTVTISNPSSGTIATATATGLITDDDSAGQVSINPGAISVTEGDTGSVNALVTLERTGGTGAPFSVTLTSSNNTATAGADYTAINQVVTFGAQVNSVVVPIAILGDLIQENTETFNLTLSSPTNGATLGSNGVVSIVDNDVVGTVTIGSLDINESNGGTTAALTVTRSGGGAAFTVQYATADNSATAPSDYAATSGTLTFAAGQNTATINIPIVGDTVVEPDESFTVNLSNLTGGGTLLTSVGTVRILNDDGLPTQPGTGGGPTNSGTTTFVTSSYVQPASDTQTTISTQNNSGTDPINITGNAGNQTIIGNYGGNVLTGGGGADTLIGLLGNDTYVVTTSNTVIAENANEGSDTVQTTVDYVLSPNASVEFLSVQDASSTTNINLTGSTSDQQITGNAGNNILNGFGGNDTMIGLGGNDTYLVRGPGDVVIEANGGGDDTVFTTVSYNLGANEVERLSTVVQADTTNIDLIGNFATQAVIGNYGNNVLNGGSGGNDTLIGLRGDDVYAVGSSSVIIFENAGEGNDTVVAAVDYTLAAGVSVEVLAAQNRAGTGALTLRGNEVSQTIAGNDGPNTIDGGLGNDTLIGGAGADRFAFSTALGPNNVDVIADFQAGTDKIGLASSIFGVTAVNAINFTTGTAATTADQRIIYNSGTGQLFFDTDGSGANAAVLFAVVTPGTALTTASFEVIGG